MRQPIDNCARNMGSDGNVASAERRRLVEELHAPARRNFPRRYICHSLRIRRPMAGWYRRNNPYLRFSEGYHYITVIDVLSKYAWVVPLKNKSGSETANAIAEIIRKSGRHPKNLQTDIGKEFYNADVQRLVKKYGINHYLTYSVLKASVVEQFNRTLKNDMWKTMFTLNAICLRLTSSYKWFRSVIASHVELQRLKASNDRYVTRWHNPRGSRLLTTVHNHVKIAGPAKFKMGDSVRVSKYKTIFVKGYT